MKRWCWLALIGILVAIPMPAASAQAQAKKRPNIIIILADDAGFSDVGCFGAEIQTPNIDRLAAQGLRFSQFYNCALCGPSRASLMTGLYPHQAGVFGWTGLLNNRCDGSMFVAPAAAYSL